MTSSSLRVLSAYINTRHVLLWIMTFLTVSASIINEVFFMLKHTVCFNGIDFLVENVLYYYGFAMKYFQLDNIGLFRNI